MAYTAANTHQITGFIARWRTTTSDIEAIQISNGSEIRIRL